MLIGLVIYLFNAIQNSFKSNNSIHEKDMSISDTYVIVLLHSYELQSLSYDDNGAYILYMLL